MGIQDFGRYADPSVLVLSSLADGPKHGYAMTKDIATFAGVSLQPASLYGAIGRLEARGLIEALPSDDRRRPYKITGAGAEALESQLRRLQAVASTGLTRLATV